MPYADLPDVRLYYEHGGSGPRLLFVNGTGTDLRRQPSPLAWPFASDFELLVYDHRGLGRSEPADPDRQPTMADFALGPRSGCAPSSAGTGSRYSGSRSVAWSRRRSRSAVGTACSASSSRARRVAAPVARPTRSRRRSG